MKECPMRHRRIRGLEGWVFVAGLVLIGSCQDGHPVVAPTDSNNDNPSLICSIPTSELHHGGTGKDGIPALSNPPLVRAGQAEAAYLRDDDRIVGVVVGGEAIAIPLNILWWHEVVNLEAGGRRFAVTHCPLTGSSLAFDREPLGGVELGVSGLLYRSNLIMYDRSDDESLWPQMLRGAACGSQSGTGLVMLPVLEATWAGWRVLYPGTRVVGSNTGVDRNYRVYPYGEYARIDNDEVLFPFGQIDRRRPPKERVLGIPDGANGGRAYPFGALASLGGVVAVNDGAHVVFWNQDAQAAMAYRPETEGQPLTFEVVDGRITDRETGSTWETSGIASDGPLMGRQLEPLAEAYIAFWFAWAAFHEHTSVWPQPAI
jgi:hypothetical protein